MAERSTTFMLTVNDLQVKEYVKELIAYLQGRLQELDQNQPKLDDFERWDQMIVCNAEFCPQQFHIHEDNA